MCDLQRYVYVKTFGCQMNLYDTDRMVQVLRPDGYKPTDDPSRADLILVNTCSVRERAEHKMVSALGRYRRLKEFNDDLVIGVAGCVATQERERLFKTVPFIDLVVGPDNIASLPTMVRDVRKTQERAIETKFLNKRQYDWIPLEPVEGQTSAMLTIMKGCNKCCSFCIVPFTRGREVSKPAELVVDEVERLVAAGVREVTLLGQNVNSYGHDRPGEPDFAGLLALVNEVDGLERIRFTTSHPWDCTDELVACFGGKLDKVCEYFHLPVQSGADSMLQRMKRGYTIESYLERIEALRAACPDISMSTDIIVGFPGETEEEFEATLALLERVRYDRIFAFAYSERPGTPASKLDDDVSPADKKRRLAAVLETQDRIGKECTQRFAERTVQVLVEGPSRDAARAGCGFGFTSQLQGRNRHNIVVNFDNSPEQPVRVGQLVDVRVERVLPHSLFGELVQSA